MIAARQIAFGRGGKRKPYDAEIEYLESTGTQWIELPYRPFEYSKQLKTTIGYQLTRIDKRQLSGSPASYIEHCSNSGYVGTGSIAADLNKHTLVLNGYGDPRITFDGVGINISTFLKTTNDKYQFAIGNLKADSVSYPSYWKLYAVRVENDIGELLNDLIPVRKGNIGYMYDRVSGQLFGNAGEGEFVLGSDVVPVEYIESHGTEYIPLDDIHPNYYTYRNIALDYQLTKIEAALIQMTGSSLLNVILCTGGGYVGSINTGIPADLDPHKVVFDGVTSPYHVSYDGTSIKTFDRSTNSVRVFTLFGTDQSGTFDPSCHMKLTRMTIRSAQNGMVEHDYIPVRVGTDETSWEGAIMDMITRRVYRNQGTGKLVFGADI